LFIN